MKTSLKSIALAASLLLSVAACSANAESPASVDSVKKAFHTRFPAREVQSVAKTPVKGIYEVVVKGKQIVYVDEKVNYIFVGDLIDASQKLSLTEKRMAELNKVDWKTLPFEYAFKDVRGNGKRQMAVFTDPDCPFCKRLEQESLKDVTDVTIYTFLYPLTQLHPDAMNKAKKIWCSPDKPSTWTAFMRDGKALTGTGTCDTSALDNIQALGEQLGITGTPTLIFPNGQLVPGAISAEEIEQLLSAK